MAEWRKLFVTSHFKLCFHIGAKQNGSSKMYLFEHDEVRPVDEVEDDEDGWEHHGTVLVQLQHSAAFRAALLGLAHLTLQLLGLVIWPIW